MSAEGEFCELTAEERREAMAWAMSIVLAEPDRRRRLRGYFGRRPIPSTGGITGGMAMHEDMHDDDVIVGKPTTSAALAQIMKAREAIEAHAGPDVRSGASGRIDCPVCGSKETLYYARARTGRIRATCRTPGCVNWIE